MKKYYGDDWQYENNQLQKKEKYLIGGVKRDYIFEISWNKIE